MSQPAKRKVMTAAFVSTAILAALFVPFQKAGGNGGYDSIVSQLAFTAAEAPADQAAAPPALTVGVMDLSGNPIQGIWVTVTHSGNGTTAGSGYTPLTLAAASAAYNVTVADYDGKTFQYWKDNGSTDRSRSVDLSGTTTITAVYDTGDALRGITPLNYTGTEEQPDLTVHALTTSNQTLHMYAIIDPQPSKTPGTATYKVYAGNYQEMVFDHWEDGSTESIRTLTVSDGKTITAYYRANPTGPAVHMDDTTVSTGQSLWSGRPAHAEFVTPASSLVGKQINSITMTLKKSGSPTGMAEIGVINTDLSMKNVFATLDVSTLSASYEEFELRRRLPIQ